MTTSTVTRKREKPKALHTDAIRGSLPERAEEALKAYAANGLVMPGDSLYWDFRNRLAAPRPHGAGPDVAAPGSTMGL